VASAITEFLVLLTHMGTSRTSGLVTVENIVTTARLIKVCLIKLRFLR
jgi:hypothetical protein